MAMATNMATAMGAAKPMPPADRVKVHTAIPAGRLAAAIGVLAVGTALVCPSLALAIVDSKPEVAASLAPNSATVLAQLAARDVAQPNVTEAVRRHAGDLAKRALLADATDASAAASLALARVYENKLAAARDLMRYSEQLSRRDVRAQLWMIQDSVARDDVNRALRHYDITLRTSVGSRNLLYTVLGGAIADPAIRDSLSALLRSSPAWGPGFLEYLANSEADPHDAAALLIQLPARGVEVAPETVSALVGRLVAANDPIGAWRFYATLTGSASPRTNRDPNFSRLLPAPSPFDWAYTNDAETSASPRAAGDGGGLDFETGGTSEVVVTKQLQLLTPGRYALATKATGMAPAGKDSIFWSLRCSDGRELARLPLRPGDVSEQVDLSVPSGCSSQWLSLISLGEGTLEKGRGVVNLVSIRPV